ncbi:MAG TPA: membrane-bound O-acyltransferase family protein [Phycisphaerales bacterium]|nr:membrane-bound O-acyltransferase family protein [Phycisphaerales bacterium]|tara:strand:- start:1741 stop:3153 length:1413 start_codon:yes stop_codon:yes gene_type:complete
MLFHSVIFPCFFILVYVIYLAMMRRHHVQNLWLLLASYVFYGWWDWRFLGLLLLSTLTDYVVAIGIQKADSQSTRRSLLTVSVLVNLGVLGFFKYFNFFASSVTDLFGVWGFQLDWVTLHVILPIGISFYTFQSLSYTIDVYRGQLKACRRFDSFALYVSYFPQLVAGPIERATHLLPQIMQRRRLDWRQIHLGLFLILSGYCKKMIIADNLAKIANDTFAAHSTLNGLDVILGVVAFAFQIYGDFSGYSDIARGLGKLMGFDLMVNFRLPYFAISPSDFWQRWHISLSTWLRDYLYIPLEGNRCSSLRCSINIMITMLLGGLWHGASWNFVLWGLFHGMLLILYRHLPWLKQTDLQSTRIGHRLPRMLLMFMLTLIGWVIFRCQNIQQMADLAGRVSLAVSPSTLETLKLMCLLLVPMCLVQVIAQRRRDLNWILHGPLPISAVIMAIMLVALAIWGVRQTTEFIYFQF